MTAKPWGELTPFAEPAWYTGLPSPYYNQSHIALRKAIRDWVEEHMIPNSFDWEEARNPDQSKLKEAARAGILLPLCFGAHIDPSFVDKNDERGIICDIPAKEWNGFHDLILIDELNRCGGVGPPTGLFGAMQIGTPLILSQARPEVKKRVAREILRGDKRVCLAITEPEAGSDVKNLSTTAVLSEDGKHYIVNGFKKWITTADWCEYFTTAVRTRGKPGDASGISMLLIERTEGVRTKRMSMGGQWSAGTSTVTFEDVKVPVENLLGKENEGFKLIMTNFNHERLMIAYAANRLARVCIEDAMNYAHSRKVFGAKLIEADVIRFKLAHMARLVESQTAWIESLVYQLDHLSKDQGNQFLGGTTALLKAHVGITLELVAREACQILGGISHTRGGRGERIERIYRDVRGIAIPGGSEEIMLMAGVKQQIKLALGMGAKL